MYPEQIPFIPDGGPAAGADDREFTDHAVFPPDVIRRYVDEINRESGVTDE